MANSATTIRRISIFNHQFFGITIITLTRAILFLVGMLIAAAVTINYVAGREILVLIGIALGGFLMLKALNGAFDNG